MAYYTLVFTACGYGATKQYKHRILDEIQCGGHYILSLYMTRAPLYIGTTDASNSDIAIIDFY